MTNIRFILLVCVVTLFSAFAVHAADINNIGQLGLGGNTPSCRTFDEKQCVMIFSYATKEERVDCLVDAKDQFTCHRTEKPAVNDNAAVLPGVPMTYTDMPSQLPPMKLHIVPGTQLFHLSKKGKVSKLPAPLVDNGVKFTFVDTVETGYSFLPFQILNGHAGLTNLISVSKDYRTVTIGPGYCVKETVTNKDGTTTIRLEEVK